MLLIVCRVLNFEFPLEYRVVYLYSPSNELGLLDHSISY